MVLELSIGEIFYKFRKSKGYTLKEAAGSSLSHAQLSNFEKGKNSLSINSCLKILENINVTPNEFFYAYNFSRTGQDFDKEKTNAYMTNNIIQLRRLIKKYDQNIVDGSHNKKNLLLKKICFECFLALLEEEHQPKSEELLYLKNYLSEIKEWGEFEIRLLGHAAKSFDMGTLSYLTSKMLNPIFSNARSPFVKKMVIQASINILSIFIEERQTQLSHKLILFLEETQIHEYDMYEKLTLIYQKARFEYYQGEHKNSLETMKNCQKSFEFAECFSTAQMIDKEIKELFNI